MRLSVVFAFFFTTFLPRASCRNVVYAINCGGFAHTDKHGIRYQSDPLQIGTESDHGTNVFIHRVPEEDQILYQTERYHTDSFTYQIPIPSDGEYILVLKFSEVYFRSPNMKVFDILLNGAHLIVNSLDIFEKVGYGVAHDEVISFKAQAGRILIGQEASRYQRSVPLQFVKGLLDNPKINAILLIKGTIDEVPHLPAPRQQQQQQLQQLQGSSLYSDGEEEEGIEEDDDAWNGVDYSNNKASLAAAGSRRRVASGVPAADPYSTMSVSSSLLPAAIALATAVPIVFFVCKL